MAATVDWKELLLSISGVFVAIGSLLLIFWALNMGAEKSQQRPGLRKGFFAVLAALYAVWMLIGVVKVIQGKDSVIALLGLPGGMLLFWLFARAANKVRTPS